MLQFGFNITLESQHINHANSIGNIKPNYPEFGIKVRYINKIKKDLSLFDARLMNQYKSNIKPFLQQDLTNKMKIIKY